MQLLKRIREGLTRKRNTTKPNLETTKFMLLEEQKKQREIHYTPSFGALLQENKGVALQTYKFVLQNMRRLEAGSLTDPKTGIRIEKTYTGNYPGGEGITFKVTHKGRNFFLKLIEKYVNQNSPRSYINTEKMLTRLNHKIGRYNVALIRPHLIYTPRNLDSFMVIVTDFYKKKEVITLIQGGLSEKEYKSKFEKECRKLSNLAKKYGVDDVGRQNMFFHKKSNTILIFDPA